MDLPFKDVSILFNRTAAFKTAFNESVRWAGKEHKNFIQYNLEMNHLSSN